MRVASMKIVVSVTAIRPLNFSHAFSGSNPSGNFPEPDIGPNVVRRLGPGFVSELRCNPRTIWCYAFLECP